MRFFDIDQPFASRAAPTRLTDLDRALADDVEEEVVSRTSSLTTVKQYAAPAVQPVASAIETASISMASTIERYDHLSSGDSSSISSETLITDYGLHRALNSLTISQSHIHAASKKARKNLRYLEDMRVTHDKVRSELDLAIEAYHEAFNLRDGNDDPKLEGILNCQFLTANNRLSRASREYGAYVDDLNELRHLPKLSRAALQSVYTDRKIASKLDRQDEQDISLRTKLRQHQEQFKDLERERHDVIIDTNPVQGLSQYVKSLETERDRLRVQRASLTAERNALATERIDLTAERDSLARDVSFSSGWAVDLDKALKATNDRMQSQTHEISSYKTQLSFAKAENTRYKDENKALRRQVQDLNWDLASAQDEMDKMKGVNTALKRNVEHLRSEFDEVHGQARTLERRYSDVTSSGRRSSVMEPVPSFYGGGAGASIEEMLEEGQGREMQASEKAMSL
ncbi:hypothetical protein CLAFUW4_00599 [Fulvia fulva]|uniref:Uncharacterized protein n=1 Tax=Passalora fulva TaxID=5499 RepID=A0A9Q8P2Y4_PASFU|nr:uncharacterized protein CLAFUR5_00598 [Fulvia fulva]KAK4635226.1 hypothetical protein CLAFUR4_00600 [Fulvia fulva]KAK4636742.1 hypothetical protein CLAFUR0_00601 [Fulvia fulva]UJO11162.1 hypothetical protein CLAFUR5_00598 [Fulvia fulva]WPV09132.1 hypothetical protein CLAFUW4_00599 [Fulvia fulva]WPV23322.1 hypothetical protein CLAFUW7_00604 [Fulvia fulva]